jgi:hypothetical protein
VSFDDPVFLHNPGIADGFSVSFAWNDLCRGLAERKNRIETLRGSVGSKSWSPESIVKTGTKNLTGVVEAF